jgi:hypothetical protein
MQSIGLKKTLNSMGCQSFIVQDKTAPATNIRISIKVGTRPRQIINNMCNNALRSKTALRYQKSVEFINKNVDVVYYNDYETLKKNPPKADIYIAGSDQIWHPNLCKPLFFLDFLTDNKKRYSYAASMGVTDIKPEKEKLFSSLVSKFDTVSVREAEMVPVVEKYTDKSVQEHIDPTFLLKADQWRELEEEYIIKKPFILVYAIYWDNKLNKELKKLHAKSGHDIVALCAEYSKVWANKKIYDASPGQFLWLVDHAEAVVASSFHGVAFALNFNKKLAAVINPSAPSRINSVLSKLEFSNGSIENVCDFDISSYARVNENIKKERSRALEYLKEIINE